MKLALLLLSYCLLSACGSLFVFSGSAGYISGWERQGPFSVLHDKKIRFEASNSYTTKSEEVFFGVRFDEKEINFSQSPAFERILFTITAFFISESVFSFENSYKLTVGSSEYSPVKVVVGNKDKDTLACVVAQADKARLNGIDSVSNDQCIVFIFDIKPPPPEQIFKLSLVMLNGDIKSPLEVVFTNRQIESSLR